MEKEEPMLPTDISLPFFAYGIFRPGELSFLIIEEFVDKERVEKKEILGSLMLRDGLTFFFEESTSTVSGYLIPFKKGEELKAYEVISNLEPKNLYFWKEINGFNILFGKSPTKNSITIPRYYESIKELHLKNDDYSIWFDPYFLNCLDTIKKFNATINEDDFIKSEPDWLLFFEMQKNYLLLWIVIERFTTLRYGFKNPNNRISALGSDDFWQSAVTKYVKRKHIIYSTESPSTKAEINLEKQLKSVAYYYQIRSNLTHRGKGVGQDFKTLKISLDELLKIMRFVIYKTKKKCISIRREYESRINEQN